MRPPNSKTVCCRSLSLRRWRAGAVSSLLGAITFLATGLVQGAITEVRVYDFDFSANAKGGPVVNPVIDVNDTIRWVWDEGFHSTTSAGGQGLPWDSGDFSPVHQFEFTFSQTGTFNYFCDIHGQDLGGGNVSGMAGFITVVPEPAAGATLAGLALVGFCLFRSLRRIRGRGSPPNWPTP